MALTRPAGNLLVAAGILLVAIYALPTLYGAAMSRLAILEFRAQAPANHLWSAARIRAYQRTLPVAFARPQAILRVHRVGIEMPVLEGTSELVLNRAVGHIAGTSLPGERGNIGLTGHRDGFFRPLKDVAVGDTIDLVTADHTDHYRIRSTGVVSPDDISVLRQTREPKLTLVTCYPFYFIGAAPQRFIVQAWLIPATDSLPTTAHLSSHLPPGD